MGRRSRFVSHRRTYLKKTRRAWEASPPGMGWREYRAHYLKSAQEVIRLTFKTYRRLKQTALPKEQAKGYRRMMRRRLLREVRHAREKG